MFDKIWTVLSLLIFLSAPALAQEKFALVIGNSAYENIKPLKSPVNDAALIAARLEEIGFEVTMLQDASLVDMKRSIGRHGKRLEDATDGAVGLLYYAGHGVNALGANYLLPVDVGIADASDLSFVGLSTSTLALSVGEGSQNIVILNCCARNPFQDVRDSGDGLVAMFVPKRNYVAYSTPAKGWLPAGDDDISLFGQTLADTLTTPGLTIDGVLDGVNERMMESLGEKAKFFRFSSIDDPYELVGRSQISAEELAWNSIQDDINSAKVVAFLSEYPEGEFAGDAKNLLVDLLSQELATPADEPVSEEPVDIVISDPFADAPQTPLPQIEGSTLPQIEASTLPQIEESPLPLIEEAAEPEAEESELPQIEEQALTVTFSEPLTRGAAEIVGKSIEQIIKTSPIFPPVEGLPDSYWKDETCANCHQWNKADLCTQANFYLGETGDRSLTKQHPFGGTFKENLRDWADGGCL